jgi:hypothetical protein
MTVFNKERIFYIVSFTIATVYNIYMKSWPSPGTAVLWAVL